MSRLLNSRDFDETVLSTAKCVFISENYYNRLNEDEVLSKYIWAQRPKCRDSIIEAKKFLVKMDYDF